MKNKKELQMYSIETPCSLCQYGYVQCEDGERVCAITTNGLNGEPHPCKVVRGPLDECKYFSPEKDEGLQGMGMPEMKNIFDDFIAFASKFCKKPEGEKK